MLRNIAKSARVVSRVAAHSKGFAQQPKFIMAQAMSRSYYKDNVLMPREYGDGYMADPIATAERIIRLIALHDNVNDPSGITLS